ncbi:ShlB/FhaC/HecB family hemolysin secretion/activation protein [Sphingomonas sp. TREG-RG-20F-R18-01]|uniref:ShlB/FhaC/HecB family hemolysin secretion/activation protein n=1 Tax=Sphingomonas sp. TREG-RG-20F-R18-01 TaxID=2914982 RepID=UPI001F573D0F|nr:ShlB/FhaC/HecB family hemolysin secretion/activation protein [Sphingomonas sp. TREG-RG-20F-R18-01]
MKIRYFSLILLATAPALHAQRVPSAGGQLQQIPPAPTTLRADPGLVVAPPAAAPDVDPAGPRIRVSTLRISGETLYDEGTLLAASGVTAGSNLNLYELRAAAARIAAFYKARGYFLAQAYLPAQDVQGGSVTIAVIEGRYGAVTIDNATNFKPGVARGILRGIDTGDIVASAPLERRLLLLSDIPGVAVQSTLSPGTDFGASNLNVAMAPGRRVTGDVSVDNAGNRYTGAYRGGGSINLNNATGLGDTLGFRVLASTEGMAYGRASWQVPVGNLTVGAAYAHFRYDLSHEFESLNAHGTADIAAVYASYPLVRSRNANLYAVGELDAKWYDDRIDLTGSRSRRMSKTGTLGLNGNTRDGLGGGGLNVFSVGWTIGDLDLRTPLDRAADALTARSNGTFNKFNFSAARLQSVAGPLSLYGAVRGQVALDNLDTSEKMELGGAYNVRAYPEGEAYGDQGYIATAEARLMVSDWTRGFPGQLQLIGFVDTGHVQYSKDKWFVGRNHTQRSGYGGGIAWMAPENFTLRGTYARKIGDVAATSAPDRAGQFWFQVAKTF